MTLSELRKIAIRRQFRIRFRIANGSEVHIDQHGVVRVPALDGPPDFQVETELAPVAEFHLDTFLPAGKSTSRACSRQELERLCAAGAETPESGHDHDD